ncbi:branched-chain amino acid transaminase [Niveibacterium sp. SC-1]|uniref:branched-chain amino acid transaminase n=1 Tax=Niveibacterium sp. SC-1 TaxID=3135646 RepID=UPI00311EA137
MASQMKDGWIWMDGEFRRGEAATVHVGTHTLHYGLGCFEGIRSYAGPDGVHVFQLDAHIERLAESARLLGLELPYSQDTLAAACIETVRRNGLTDGYLRPLVFLGDERLGIDPEGLSVHVAIMAWSWGRYLGPEALDKGVRARISSWQRHHPNVMPTRAKSIASYTNSILASREARAEGYDEAILLDTEGFVAEGPGENIFVVRKGRLIEPDLVVALDGITRRTVHALARTLGLELESARLTRDALYLADEVFFSGTAAEITPVVEIDRKRVGDGRPGPVTRALQEAFFAAVRGQSSAHREWLSAVA